VHGPSRTAARQVSFARLAASFKLLRSWTLLFLLYTAELFDIIASLGLTGHSYADDTQVYISAPVVESQQAAACLAECIERLDRWMGQNGLKLNAEKTRATDVAWITASTSQADHLSAPSVDNYVIFNGWHSVDCKWFGCHFGRSADNDYTRLCLPCRFFPATSAALSSPITTEATRALVQAFISCRLDYCNSVLAGVSDSSQCRMRQPAWSPGLVVTTTSHRFLLAYTVFQYASESATIRRCLCGSVYTMQHLATWLTCVCRPTLCVVASNCLLHQIRLCALSSVISRPTCFSTVRPAPSWLFSEFGAILILRLTYLLTYLLTYFLWTLAFVVKETRLAVVNCSDKPQQPNKK